MKARYEQTPNHTLLNYSHRCLLSRIDPVAGESPLGYLRRVAGRFRYDKGGWLDDLMGRHVHLLDAIRGRDASEIASALRLQLTEWKALCCEEVSDDTRGRYCRFFGQPIRLGRLNLTRPRVCPECLCESEVCPAIWDLAIFASCPKHHRELVAECWKCCRPIRWSRLTVTQCRCGADLRQCASAPADVYVDSMSAALLRAGYPRENDQHASDSVMRFPPELNRLGLNSLAILVSFLGAMGRGRHVKQTSYAPTSLANATQVVRAAGNSLRIGPRAFTMRYHSCKNMAHGSQPQSHSKMHLDTILRS